MSEMLSHPDRPLCVPVDPKADSPLSAQFQPPTESAPELVLGPNYAGEAGPDCVRAIRRRKGPHSTARFFSRDVRLLGFVRYSGNQI